MRTEPTGFSSVEACHLVGITYRQIDYWARSGLLEPSLEEARGQGTYRRWSFTDVLLLKVVRRLLDAGMSLTRIRAGVDVLLKALHEDQATLSELTLLSDGTSIYTARSSEEVVDVFRTGRPVFGVAIGPLERELKERIFVGDEE